MNTFKNIVIGLLTVTLLGTTIWCASKEQKKIQDEHHNFSETIEVNQKTYIVDGAVAQSASTPIGGNLYEIRWMNAFNNGSSSYTEHGTAITSYKEIKVGDKVSVKQSVLTGTRIQYITEWKPSSTPSW